MLQDKLYSIRCKDDQYGEVVLDGVIFLYEKDNIHTFVASRVDPDEFIKSAFMGANK